MNNWFVGLIILFLSCMGIVGLFAMNIELIINGVYCFLIAVTGIVIYALGVVKSSNKKNKIKRGDKDGES